MKFVDTHALEQQAWQRFVQELGGLLADHWPAMQERLGERYETFIGLSVEQGLQIGLQQAAAIARYVNLSIVWGPAFQDRAGWEWARALIGKAHEHEWLCVHQLVQGSLKMLRTMDQRTISVEALQRVDEALLGRYGRLGRRGSLTRQPADTTSLPAQACDFEAIELTLLDDAASREVFTQYEWSQGDWSRVPRALPAALRVRAPQGLPAELGALSATEPGPAALRMQIRCATAASCDADHHPAIAFLGPHGQWDWAGHETRACSWPLLARALPERPEGPASLLAEESSPELYRLGLDCCGLRDEGEVMGPQAALLRVWPSHQWWCELQRSLAPVQTFVPGGRAWAPGPTRWRAECDGKPRHEPFWQRQFAEGLDRAATTGLAALVDAWGRLPGLSAAQLEVQLGLFTGEMSGTWGWSLAGLDQAAWMRVLLVSTMDACRLALELRGDLVLGDSRSRLSLRVDGRAELRPQIARTEAAQELLPTLLSSVVRWHMPLQLSLEPLSHDAAQLLQLDGPCTGAVVGEAGLRPCTHGRSGWEWFVGLRVEAVAAPCRLIDPLLGETRQTLQLLPALELVNWSLG